jgi:hypothetical protein
MGMDKMPLFTLKAKLGVRKGVAVVWSSEDGTVKSNNALTINVSLL